MKTSTSQTAFISNNNNKIRFITGLSRHLTAHGVKVFQAKNDADVLVMLTAVELSRLKRHITVVDDDTDILILLVHPTDVDKDVSRLCPGASTRPDKIFSSNHLQQGRGNLKQCIFFIHAASGCDTTSAVYRKGKADALKTLESNEELQRQIGVFYIKTSSC